MDSTLLGYIAYGLGIALSAIVIWVLKTYVAPLISKKAEELEIKIGSEKYKTLKERLKDLMSSAETQFDKIGTGAEKQAWVTGEIMKVVEKMQVDIDVSTIENLIKGLMIPLETAGILNRK